jgi:hypothetical protein
MKGFTILEVLLSLIILSFFIFMIFFYIFWIKEKSDVYKVRSDLLEEMIFLRQKISWVLENSEIIEPLAGATSSFIKVNKRNFNLNPILLEFFDQNLLISYAGGEKIKLNSSLLKILNAAFHRDSFPQGDALYIMINLKPNVYFEEIKNLETKIELKKFLPK